MKNIKILPVSLLGTLVLVFGIHSLPGQANSSLVYLDGGQLSYKTFAVVGQISEVNVVPDFSYAGYMKGGVALPDVPVQISLSPKPGDNRAAIQAAIDYVESLPLNAEGIRGAVLLKKGIYEVNGALSIEASGVVLRGEGQGSDGTILFASLRQNHDFIQIQGKGNGIDEDLATTVPITSSYVPIGSQQLVVASATSFAVGDRISTKRTPNQGWIDSLDMGQYGWTPSSYSIKHERIITAIHGDTLSLDLPMVDVIEDLYGGGTVSQTWMEGRISQCGVENLRIRSYYASSTDEEHVWKAVRLRRCTNSWVKGVTAQYCGYACVSIESESNFNTVEECAMIDQRSQISGGRRYSFNISDGLGNLFQRCYTSEGRHDFVTSSRVAGPNVFLDCYAENTLNDIGPHHRWTTGTLFDNIKGGLIRVQNRGASGSGHGWAGAQTMFWNCVGSSIKVESAPGSMNWGIGCVGSSQEGTGFWESWNQHVMPRSLYLQQLKDRLGQEAVDNIALPEQQNGDIYDLLRLWAGEGSFNLPPEETATRVTASEDAHVSAGSFANDNYGMDSLLNSNASSIPSAISEVYLKFDLSLVTQVFEKAILRLKVSQNSGTPIQELIYIADDSWSEDNITWSNKASESTVLGQESARSQGLWVEFDISQQALSEIKGDGLLSLNIKSKGNNQLVRFYSTESRDSTNWPEISFIPRKEERNYEPMADAYVKGGAFASDNFGAVSSLVSQSSSDPSAEYESYLKFDLTAISSEVSRATLRVKVDSQVSNPYQSLWKLSDDGWGENSINWSNRPTGRDSVTRALTPGTGNWLEFDVSMQVRDELARDSSISFMLKAEESEQYSRFFAREDNDAANRPHLWIQTVVQTSIPTNNQTYRETGQANLSFYPNPLIDASRITFELTKAGPVFIVILDFQGMKLQTLVNQTFTAGKHSLTWDGRSSNGIRMPAGFYMVRMKSVEGEIGRKILIR